MTIADIIIDEARPSIINEARPGIIPEGKVENFLNVLVRIAPGFPPKYEAALKALTSFSIFKS